jgi:hypothetical protein
MGLVMRLVRELRPGGRAGPGGAGRPGRAGQGRAGQGQARVGGRRWEIGLRTRSGAAANTVPGKLGPSS